MDLDGLNLLAAGLSSTGPYLEPSKNPQKKGRKSLKIQSITSVEQGVATEEISSILGGLFWLLHGERSEPGIHEILPTSADDPSHVEESEECWDGWCSVCLRHWGWWPPSQAWLGWLKLKKRMVLLISHGWELAGLLSVAGSSHE